MAREVISIVNVWCDNTGRHTADRVAATTTAVLAYDGRLVRLDLCTECRDEMSSVLGEYAEYGQTSEAPGNARVDTTWTAVEKNDAIPVPLTDGGPTRPAAPRARRRRPHQAASANEVRAWLRAHADEHGGPVPEGRSRLSDELKAAYDRAHGWDEIDGTWRPTDPAPAGDPAAPTGTEGT
jgi:hypothetical protein